jgi:cell division protein FtsI (penicillin-binding protein 3)
MLTSTIRSRRVAPGILRTRFQVALLLTFIWVGIIALRLVYLQVMQHDYYIARANKQRQSVVTLYPERGPIVDRQGKQLAVSLEVDSLYGIPEEMKDVRQVLDEIAQVTPLDEKEILSHIEGRSFFWITRRIPPEIADQIRKLQLPGVYFTEESRRYYPNKELASHVLGFVGLDNKGLSGVEYQYEGVVAGVPGKLLALRDAKRRLLLQNTTTSLLAPTRGRTLQLTIDSVIQHIAEQELQDAVEKANAKAGMVIILNPYNGEVLALANNPDFNPNAFSDTEAARWKNRAIQDYYEPGSTFKAVVAAGALDRGVVTPEDMFDCQMGSIVIMNHVIHDHKPFGVLSVRQIVEKSSDVGMIKIGMKLGPQGIYDYAKQFGFAQKTGIDLPGETTGILRPVNRWSGISIGAISMGQEIGVTALQVVRMMSAMANGGYLPTPHCVARISDSAGQMQSTVFNEPQLLPVKHNTILELQQILQAVVEDGTAKEAIIPGYSVAGKTGTAEKIGPNGTYMDGRYIASFVGYAPASHPVISMIAVIDEPKGLYHGGEVAAPLFRKIGQQVLKYLDIPPDQVTENPALQASAFPRPTEATPLPEGMEPAAYTPPDQHHKLENANDDGKASELVMPYLYGKTAGESVEILTKIHVPFRMVGTGMVVQQFPAPGAMFKKDDLCIITLGDSQQLSENLTAKIAKDAKLQ